MHLLHKCPVEVKVDVGAACFGTITLFWCLVPVIDASKSKFFGEFPVGLQDAMQRSLYSGVVREFQHVYV